MKNWKKEKRRIAVILLAMSVVFFSLGLFFRMKENKYEGITVKCTKDTVYQYQEAVPEDFIVVFKDGTESGLDSAKYKFSSPVYNSNNFSIEISGKSLIVNLNYVKVEDITWYYDGKLYIDVDEYEDLDPSRVTGVLTYEDSTVQTIEAEDITSDMSDPYNPDVVVIWKGQSFKWDVYITGLDDGIDEEDLNLEKDGSTVKLGEEGYVDEDDTVESNLTPVISTETESTESLSTEEDTQMPEMSKRES